jgi:predicted metal-binding protein
LEKGVGEMINNTLQHDHTISCSLKELIQLACRSGASGAAAISTADILVEDDLANLCREPRCENFGLSPSCPPHVSGPSGFRGLLQNFKHAIVIKIDVPLEILLSSERRDIMKLLHEMAASIEQTAIKAGCPGSKAFAGGSCKNLFCHDHASCRVLAEGGECRNPRRARPSMSGFGINVSKLMQAAGWTMNRYNSKTDLDTASTAPICGLILVG